MTKRTYTLEPQRLEPGRGYVLCEPHQAARVVLLEISSFPPKAGRRRYRISRNFAVFYGAGALARAQAQLDTLTRGTAPAPKERKIWGRSLTTEEYENAIRQQKAQREPKWKRFPAQWNGSNQGRSE